MTDAALLRQVLFLLWLTSISNHHNNNNNNNNNFAAATNAGGKQPLPQRHSSSSNNQWGRRLFTNLFRRQSRRRHQARENKRPSLDDNDNPTDSLILEIKKLGLENWQKLSQNSSAADILRKLVPDCGTVDRFSLFDPFDVGGDDCSDDCNNNNIDTPSLSPTNSPSSVPLSPLFGMVTRVVVRPDAEVHENYRLELDPALASALLLEKLGAGDFFMKRAGPKWFDRIASRFLSRRSRSAIFTIIEIIQSFEDHGVVDVFAKFTQPQLFWSLVAYSGLQKTIGSEGLADQYHATDTTTSLVHLAEVRDPSLMEKLAHYSVYASAVYGWKLGFAMKGTTFLGKIRQGRFLDVRRLSCRVESGKSHDEPPLWKRTANGTIPSISDMSFFLWRTGRKESDIVAAEWESDTHRPGYVIIRDSSQKVLVFSIRGTWSFHDVLTDLCCTPQVFSIDGQNPEQRTNNTNEPIEEDDDDQDLSASLSQRLWNWFYSSSKSSAQTKKEDAIHSAHHGMLEAAQVLIESTQDILKEEFLKNPDYALIIVGHSMGGGVAALLGTLWSERFPVSVFVYGPPCIAPLNATPLVGPGSSNIVSVITEGDPFGFISLGHIAELSVALDRLCADKRLRDRVLKATLFRREDDKERKQDSWWLLHTMRYLHANCTGEKLYPPGRLLLLKQQLARDRHRDKWTLKWTVRRIPPEYFAHFQVRPSMLDLSKHMPSLYEEALRALTC